MAGTKAGIDRRSAAITLVCRYIRHLLTFRVKFVRSSIQQDRSPRLNERVNGESLEEMYLKFCDFRKCNETISKRDPSSKRSIIFKKKKSLSRYCLEPGSISLRSIGFEYEGNENIWNLLYFEDANPMLIFNISFLFKRIQNLDIC